MLQTDEKQQGIDLIAQTLLEAVEYYEIN